MSFLVVGRVLENNSSITVHCHPIVRDRQSLRGEPEAQRALRHQVECPTWRDGRCASRKRYAVKFCDEGEVAHRVVPIFRTKVEVVNRQCLLIERRIWALGESQHDGVHVTHVVAAHDVGTVCEATRMLVTRRAQKQCSRIDGATRNNDKTRGKTFLRAVPAHDDQRDFAT